MSLVSVLHKVMEAIFLSKSLSSFNTRLDNHLYPLRKQLLIKLLVPTTNDVGNRNFFLGDSS